MKFCFFERKANTPEDETLTSEGLKVAFGVQFDWSLFFEEKGVVVEHDCNATQIVKVMKVFKNIKILQVQII